MQETKNVLPKVDCKFENELHKLEKLLSIYCICKDKQIRGFEKVVLKYYLKYGYSKDIKTMIAQDTGKRIEYVNTTNTFLRDRGFLIQNKYKETYLSEDMEMLRKFFIEDNKKLYIVALDG